MVSGGEFSHSTAPDSEGAPPSTGRVSSTALGFAFIIMAGLAAIIAGPPFITTVGSVGLAFIIMAGLSPPAGLADIIAGPPFITTVGSVGFAFIIMVGLSLPPRFADIMAPPFMTTED